MQKLRFVLRFGNATSMILVLYRLILDRAGRVPLSPGGTPRALLFDEIYMLLSGAADLGRVNRQAQEVKLKRPAHV